MHTSKQTSIVDLNIRVLSLWADLEKFLGGRAKYSEVAQFNVLLELQLRTSLEISQMPVKSANTGVGKSHIWEGVLPPLLPLNPPMPVDVLVL